FPGSNHQTANRTSVHMSKIHKEIKNVSQSGHPSSNEKDWLAQAKAGDMDAFRKLVERHEQQIYSTALGMLGNEHDAREVTQKAFIRFFKGLKQFRGDSQLSTYLTRIAINLSLNEIRSQSRRSGWMRLIGKDDKAIDLPDHSQDPDREDTRQMVQDAIRQLPPDFRSVVVLRMIEGYSTKETAEILDLPMGTIGSRLNRAQKQLKTILSSWLDLEA
ncbi:MAG: sigma-70 family RNA polymerase sigma factor, partial [Bacteroidota bacterium]